MQALSTMGSARRWGHAGIAFLEGVGSTLAAAFQALRRARERARAQQELRALSDHLLRDIGLHRSQIDGLFGRDLP
jgi:uncharacterized protein YjiS (DUF1127 family)